MLGMSSPTIRKYLKALIDINVLTERRNPKYKWDKTLQYRVNLSILSQSLHKIGYDLEGYRNISSLLPNNNITPNQNDLASNQNDLASKQNDLGALPETTTETTTEETSLLEEDKKQSSSKSTFSDFTAHQNHAEKK